MTGDDTLLRFDGPSWWKKTSPAPSAKHIGMHTPLDAQLSTIEKFTELFEKSSELRALVLIDDGNIALRLLHPPATDDSLFFGYSLGKTVTAAAIGQAINQNIFRLDETAESVIDELKDTPLGRATVRDLLTMSSGSAEPYPNTTFLTNEAWGTAWQDGTLNLLDELLSERVSAASSKYSREKGFSYKSTDPMLLGAMFRRKTGISFGTWIQQQILDQAGVMHPGLYSQDRGENAQSDSGLRLKLDDWIRFAIWFGKASREDGKFGDFLRSAMTEQVSNPGFEQRDAIGRMFSGYGYLMWTGNKMAPNTSWATGIGGQRIGWALNSNRIILAFAVDETLAPKIYRLAREWLND